MKVPSKRLKLEWQGALSALIENQFKFLAQQRQ